MVPLAPLGSLLLVLSGSPLDQRACAILPRFSLVSLPALPLAGLGLVLSFSSSSSPNGAWAGACSFSSSSPPNGVWAGPALLCSSGHLLKRDAKTAGLTTASRHESMHIRLDSFSTAQLRSGCNDLLGAIDVSLHAEKRGHRSQSPCPSKLRFGIVGHRPW